MRTLIAIGVILVILIIGGAMTSMLIGSNGGVLPILTTTTVPDASPTVVLPWKAEQFFLLVGFLIFNLVGIALTLAVIVWAVDRGLRRNRTSAGKTPAATVRAAAEE